MNNSVSQSLLLLSKIDQQIHFATAKKNEILNEQQNLAADLQSKRKEFAELETAYKVSSLKQKAEEARLQDEEKRISERRKQLTAMGGIKGAKLIEREIDIAARVLRSVEEQALRSMEDAEGLKRRTESLSEQIGELDHRIQESTPAWQQSVLQIGQQLESLGAERQELVSQLGERLERLYEKVTIRYRGDAVALAEKGSCRRCYRALPPQTYNQVLAGNTAIQCPGCMRILVCIPEEEPADKS